MSRDFSGGTAQSPPHGGFTAGFWPSGAQRPTQEPHHNPTRQQEMSQNTERRREAKTGPRFGGLARVGSLNRSGFPGGSGLPLVFRNPVSYTHLTLPTIYSV